MTIDERLEKLVERHEALTQSVELMVREGQRLQRLVESHERRIVRLERGGKPNGEPPEDQ